MNGIHPHPQPLRRITFVILWMLGIAGLQTVLEGAGRDMAHGLGLLFYLAALAPIVLRTTASWRSAASTNHVHFGVGPIRLRVLADTRLGSDFLRRRMARLKRGASSASNTRTPTQSNEAPTKEQS